MPMNEDSLNDAQAEAVTTKDGSVLIIAGAGSGKTFTLARRVAHLIDQGVDPVSILLLTFTRKASQEMLSRAAFYADDRCKKVSGGTFHSFANQILRRYGDIIGYSKNFNIIDETDATEIIQRIREEFNIKNTKTRFPKKETLQNIFSKSVNTGIKIDDILAEEYPQFVNLSAKVHSIFEHYNLYKKQKSLMDYDDLLSNLLAILKDHQIRQRLNAQYKYVMVDEFQDTNHIQGYITALLGSHSNILVVGDDTQCIYSFRGSSVNNILDFPKLFPESKIIKLERNYRSTGSLLDFSNAVTENIRLKHDKKLYSELGKGELPYYVKIKNEREQSNYICDEILRLREEGINLNHMAVLMRSSWHSNDLEIELSNRKIPFKKFGGKKFIESAHIKDIIMFFRILHNISDVIAWYRILLLIDNIGHKTAEQIIYSVTESAKDFNGLLSAEFQEKIYFSELKSLYNLLINIQKIQRDIPEMMNQIIEFYSPYLKEKYDDYLKREKDIKTFVAISERFESLEEFLVSMSLEPPTDIQTEIQPGQKEDEFLVLSTIHSAKGLEWHSVFILDLIDGLFPSSYTLTNEDKIDEERRLFYVACTRAKRKLYLMNPGFVRSGWNDGFDFSLPSRFITEIQNINQLTETTTYKNENASKTEISNANAETIERIDGYFNR